MSEFFRGQRRSVSRAIDLVVLSGAFWLAFLLRFDGAIPPSYIEQALFVWLYVVLLQYAGLLAFRVPSFAWRYVGLRETVRISLALTVPSSLILSFRLFGANWLLPSAYAHYLRVPIGVILINLVLAFLGITGVRALRRLTAERDRSRRRASKESAVPTLLIGAGEAGLMVAKEVEKRPDLGMRLVGFVDDNPTKHGNVLHGLKVLGGTSEIGPVAQRTGAQEAIITIANAAGEDVRRIRGFCDEAQVPVRIIPSLFEILEGKLNLGRVREVSIEDLLRRPVVELETERLERFLKGRRVLVTGAGGSIGSEISRQVARFGPEVLVLLERSEPALFAIHSELREEARGVELVPCLTDLCDEDGVEVALTTYGPHVIFHAAAYKHVPMLEWNGVEAVKNNVMGTRTVVDAADRHGVEAFVMLSTDKAVNPTSIMGATKRTAEMLLQAKDRRSPTKYVSVRFGNVLGSAGSVVPIFKEQISAGGPVKVTHPEMLRYFMTISEATQLVLTAGSMGQGGEIFLLDMGDPVKIVDLAADLIRLSGFEPDKDIAIEFTGIRPGEKLFEELGFDPKSMEKTLHPKIFVLAQEPVRWDAMVDAVAKLSAAVRAKTANGRLRRVLESIVPEMQPSPFLPSLEPVAVARRVPQGPMA